MKKQKTSFQVITLIFALSLGGTAMACTTDAWLGGATGAVNPNDPNHPTTPVPRVGGFCGLEVTGTGDVKDNNPAADATFNGRFYYFPETDTGAAMDILVAYSDEGGTAELFSIDFDGTNLTFDATAAGGNTAVVAADLSGWNLVEFSWESGGAADSGNFWVNADALTEPASSTFTPGTGAVESVRLGAPNGFGALVGKGTYDDYESRRSTNIGPLLHGDGNDDTSVDAGDINVIINEFLFGTLGAGVVDCNLDGSVDAGDINCVIAIFLGP